MSETVTLQLPEQLHQRLVNMALATKRPLENVIFHALMVGSPPDWSDVPEEYQADLAALERLDDDALWKVAKLRKAVEGIERYDELLSLNQQDSLSDSDKLELRKLRNESDLFALRKVHAASILRWRGHQVSAL